MTEALPRTLYYFADPMCSWCWGFSPVAESIVKSFPDLPVSLVMGGLRSNTNPMEPAQRKETLHHWQEVNKRTGQPFQFSDAMPEGFIYDTEPACRAVVSMIDIRRPAALAYFRSLQNAFYAEGRDITQPETLARMAGFFDVTPEQFLRHFESAATRTKTERHFTFAREAGVRGFPTIILGDERGLVLLTHGYRSFESLQPELEQWLSSSVPLTS